MLNLINLMFNTELVVYLLVGGHAFAPVGLGRVAAQGLVVVPSARLLAEAPWPSVRIHAPQFVVVFSGRQLPERQN